jgi:ribonucleotide reductase beta subunit family protein with ferritin-like domain
MKRSLFVPRDAFKPFEYEECEQYAKAINHSYWLVEEWNFLQDTHEFNNVLTPGEQRMVKHSMLAVSQVEVAIKLFWGHLYNRLQKPEIALVGTTFSESECYDDQTQVLTSNGWVNLKDVSIEDKVAQYDIETKEISFSTPIRKIEKDYSGKMHRYKNRAFDLMVTPNHELVLKLHSSKNFMKRKSSDGSWGGNYSVPISGYKDGVIDLLTPEHRLLIAIQADGSLLGACPTGEGRRDFCFTLKKERKISRLLQIFKDLGVDPAIRDRGDFKVISGVLPDWVDVDQVKDFSWVDITKVSSNFCKEFIEELGNWDSTLGRGLGTYYNANERAIDKVQILAVLAGVRGYKSVNRTAEESVTRVLPDGSSKKSAKTVFSIGFKDINTYTLPHRSEVDYEGKVYCLEMPKGTLIVKRPESKFPVVCGNCRHEMAYSKLLELLGLNDAFNSIMDVPCIKGRYEYLKKYKSYLSEGDDRNFLKALILFSLFIENVSLFSQFFILSSFKKKQNRLKDIASVVTATSKEESIHFEFGAYLINTIKEERPELWDKSMERSIVNFAQKAYEAECKVIDWIVPTDVFIKRGLVKDFLKDRFNQSLVKIGIDPLFDVRNKSEFKWYYEELSATMDNDFFDGRPSNYALKNKSITSQDLF